MLCLEGGSKVYGPAVEEQTLGGGRGDPYDRLQYYLYQCIDTNIERYIYSTLLHVHNKLHTLQTTMRKGER